MGDIIIKGARQHNLKNINLNIPRDQLVVVTGLSGSGKSSLAFDTIYAEGQRRYVESLSAYARQFLEQMEKPDVDTIEGLSPAISIEQKASSRNPRSTLGTITEIYDYLRLLFARIGIPHCHICKKPIESRTIQQMHDELIKYPDGTRMTIMAPLVNQRKGEHISLIKGLVKHGYARVRIDGKIIELSPEIKLDKNIKHNIDVVVDRIIIKDGISSRLIGSVELATSLSKGLLTVLLGDGCELFFSENSACPDCGMGFSELTPQIFSFNNPRGACTSCDGIGYSMEFNPELIVPDPSLSLRDGAIAPWGETRSVYQMQRLEALAQHFDFDIHNTPFSRLDERVQGMLLYGSGGEKINFFYEKADRRHYYRQSFEGVIPHLTRRYMESESPQIREELERYMNMNPCSSCNGGRLRPQSLAVFINGKNIHDVTRLNIRQALNWFKDLRLTQRQKVISDRILKEIMERLGFLNNVGLDYLSMDRGSATLSGGETQRVRLATQIGSRLVGVLYVLDEPSIGLHARDNQRLLKTLRELQKLGNSLIVVEHDAETMLSADHIIDMGPGAGIHGGEIVFQGPPDKIFTHMESLTGKYLSGRMFIAIPRKRRGGEKGFIAVKGARGNNLKDIDVNFPLGCLTCVTGVSGSGKSTLVVDTVYRLAQQRLRGTRIPSAPVSGIYGLEDIRHVINIDQSPIGRTPRSNPATYTGVFNPIRDLFSMLPESKKRGYKPGRFSFNVKGGRCDACDGDGIIKIGMHFLPDVYVRCDECNGLRYNRETLEIEYKGKNISQVLDMTVNQAMQFFKAIPHIQKKLRTLYDVGLGYIRLGQSAITLSGGEAQRIKLSRELSKRFSGNTLYILDEPTTGLHFDDIKKLLGVLNRLADAGNTIIIIEHNLDVIKTADYIIDLGPEGGDGGGGLIGSGTPEEIAGIPDSYTGQSLIPLLESAHYEDEIK